jgi:hypothetical protein
VGLGVTVGSETECGKDSTEPSIVLVSADWGLGMHEGTVALIIGVEWFKV